MLYLTSIAAFSHSASLIPASLLACGNIREKFRNISFSSKFCYFVKKIKTDLSHSDLSVSLNGGSLSLAEGLEVSHIVVHILHRRREVRSDSH